MMLVAVCPSVAKAGDNGSASRDGSDDTTYPSGGYTDVGYAIFGFQFHGRSSSRRLTGCPSTVRQICVSLDLVELCGLGSRPLFVEQNGRSVTDIRFAFETLQHDHDAHTFGFATGGPSLTRQEFAEECDINVLMACGRCLRPALYSSLRSSPSHPTGVSALRVTIAIANARFARKKWRASQVSCQSRGDSLAMNWPPADVSEQALLDDPPQ